MSELMLIFAAWMVLGGLALSLRASNALRDAGVLRVLFLVLAWPITLGHYKSQLDDGSESRPRPIRVQVENEEHNHSKTRKR